MQVSSCFFLVSLVLKLLFEALYVFLFLVRKAATGVRFASFLSNPRSCIFYFCIHDMKRLSFLQSMESDDAVKSVVTSFKILASSGCVPADVEVAQSNW